ncbi:MAG: hypothetical protein EHM70_05360 [Chloroflexota bacterium]|nr:MAG: hypothetical protein EHM70_05360 [Chloroflexota bacterium]
MTTLHLVSHTHWDREWYLPFQLFRLKLVHLMDNLLAILESNPDYRYFMLDGQTIVLDDYLQMRPEREDQIRLFVQSGRLVIGPWHILPDEFLVSPEATIRNLLEGDRTARKFGPKMEIGYIPDPFGHIGQMPQILRGFGIDTACVQRGLAGEPAEFWWQAPDGSRVFMAYLRDGYGNASALLPTDPEWFTAEVRRIQTSLMPHSVFSRTGGPGHLLLMNGTDHMEPSPATPAAIAFANQYLGGDVLVHSTLPAYMQAAREAIREANVELPVVTGELRASSRHHLLPGVLSTRIWIKQRNHTCETLLEKWAEPFSAWASLVVPSYDSTRLHHPAAILRQAWRLLMECHPHDSICGCSVDQVHEEMRPRFDQVEQIGEEITRQSLESLASAVDTVPPAGEASEALVVFNPTAGPRRDLVHMVAQLADDIDAFEILDEQGASLPYEIVGDSRRELFNLDLDRSGLQAALGMIQEGRVAGMVVRGAKFRRQGKQAFIQITLAETGQPDQATWERGLIEIDALMNDPGIEIFSVRACTAAATEMVFCAPDVPGYGYRTFWVRGVDGPGPLPSIPIPPDEHTIENEFFTVYVSKDEATLTLHDKRLGTIFEGLNRFTDGGDCGDEYNYSPPPTDLLVDSRVKNVRVERSPARQSIELTLSLDAPAGLSEDRRQRSAQLAPINIVTRLTLPAGTPRLDIHTTVENQARDHRLRVHFPAPFGASEASYDGHFEVVQRKTGAHAFDPACAEQPRPEAPQRAFTAIAHAGVGLAIANRGLPEVETLSSPDGASEIALTLLRCTGWLSREDFSTRRGHAGPMIATPGAQMPGTYHFDYAVIPFAGEAIPAYRQAYAFNAPLRAVHTELHRGNLPSKAAFIQSTPEGFMISAVKMAETRGENERNLIIRGYNITANPLDAHLVPLKKFVRCEQVTLSEERLQDLTLAAGGSVELKVRGYEIITLKFQDG